MRKIEIKLAKKNGHYDELRTLKIVKKVKTKYEGFNDEIAILRKMMYQLILKVKEQHPDLDLSEFNEYYSFVEECKKETDKELEI